MQLTWTKKRNDYGKIIRELPERYSVAKIYYNRKRRIIDGKSLEATTIRDRHFELRDLVNTLDGSLEDNLKKISNLTGVEFSGWIDGPAPDITKPITLRDYVRRYAALKGQTLSDDYRKKFELIERNISMFLQAYPVGSDNLNEKDEDQQKIFFSQYLSFLINDKIDNELGQKKPYENASVKIEFNNLTTVCTEFPKAGLKVNLASFVSNLKTPKGGKDQPYVTYGEMLVILKNLDKIQNLTEEKAIYTSILQYFTGLRHNELYQVEEKNITTKIVDGTSFKVLNYISDKTGKENAVPLNSVCLAVIEHWKGRKFKAPKRKKIVYTNCLMPILTLPGTLTGFRSFLERLPEFQYEIKRIRYRGTERVDQAMPRWQRLGTHAFRHGYSAYLTDRGASIDDVGQLLNHGPGSQTTKKHYQHIKEDKVILEAFKMLDEDGSIMRKAN